MAVSAKFVPLNFGNEDDSSKRYKGSTTHTSSSAKVHGGNGGKFIPHVDPIDPIEPTAPPEGETYSSDPHPLSDAGVIGRAINIALKKASNAEEAIKELLSGSDGSDDVSASAKPIVYSQWSPVSKLFGMSQDTAFSEHMANTAHQREVADLKAAGLNPVLGISGSGASSVSGNSAVGSSSAEKVDSFPWLDVIGATAGLVTTVVTKKPALGYMVANVFNAFDK